MQPQDSSHERFLGGRHDESVGSHQQKAVELSGGVGQETV